MKKGIIIVVLCMLVPVVENMIDEKIKYNALVGDSSHYSEEKKIEVDYPEVVGVNREVKINHEDFMEQLLSDNESRSEELIKSGYTEEVSLNTANSQYFRKGLEVKVLNYQEEVLVEDRLGRYIEEEVNVKELRDGTKVIEGIAFSETISGTSPLIYDREISYEYYMGEKLRLMMHEDNEVIYESDRGLIMKFSVYEDKMIISKVLVNDEVSEVSEYYKFSEEVEIEEEVIKVGSYKLQRSSNYENYDFSNFTYNLDEVTEMLEIKEEYKESFLSGLDYGNHFTIEYAVIEGYKSSGERNLRGTRSNGSSLAYPSGVPSDINTGASEQPHYVRIGHNLERELPEGPTGYVPPFYSEGFYEDKTDFKGMQESIEGTEISGEERRSGPVVLRSASLNMTVLGPGASESGSSGRSLMEHYTSWLGSNKAEELAKQYDYKSEYSLQTVRGESFDVRRLSHDNFQSWLSSLEFNQASGNVVDEAVTSIDWRSGTGKEYKFDVTNGVGEWIRAGKKNEQVIYIKNSGMDNYFATSAYDAGGATPYIELTFEEIPDFISHPYPIESTTINLRAFTSNDQKGRVYTQAIGIDGVTGYKAEVEVEIFAVEDGEVVYRNQAEGRDTYYYPYYEHSLKNSQDYYKVESNYQVGELIDGKLFEKNKVYQVRVRPSLGSTSTDWILGDKFQMYEVGYSYETFKRIMNYYGRSENILNIN